MLLRKLLHYLAEKADLYGSTMNSVTNLFHFIFKEITLKPNACHMQGVIL